MQSSGPPKESVVETQPLSDGRQASSPGALTRHIALLAHHAGGVEIALLAEGVPVTVGRAEPATLRIADPTLSREHARFAVSGGTVHVEDLGSRNGTRVAGRRVSTAELELGDEVVLGRVAVRVQALGATGQPLGIDGEETFRRRVEEELARAREFRRPFALLLVRAAPLDRGATRPSGRRDRPWLEALRARIRPVDRLALYGPDAAQVLLPETGSDEVARIARALTAPLERTPYRLLVGLACYPDAGTTVDALVEASSDAAHRASLERPIERAPSRSAAVACEEPQEGEIVVGPTTRALIEMVDRVATSRIPVILHGETGTGKEVIARLLHERGPRREKRMVRVNCGAIPRDLVESTLFGHERGAFTGAVQQQRGVFEEACGGTVFLDEVGELPLAAQAALLRVLEVGAFVRVGSTREIAVDVRVVAATHRDLEAMASTGAFRADLYYRLCGVVIEIPPLRERVTEIEPLARRFLRAANEANGCSVQGIDPEALALLQSYAWPGNVRELRNAIERAVVVARGPWIGPDDLPARVRAAATGTPEGASGPGSGVDPNPTLPPPSSSFAAAPLPSEWPGPARAVRGTVKQFEAKLLLDVLEATGWNRAKAAEQLQIPVRTLSYRMKVLGIKRQAG